MQWTNTYCANTEINEVVHEVEKQIDHELHKDNISETETIMITPRSEVYNFAVSPIKLLIR